MHVHATDIPVHGKTMPLTSSLSGAEGTRLAQSPGRDAHGPRSVDTRPPTHDTTHFYTIPPNHRPPPRFHFPVWLSLALAEFQCHCDTRAVVSKADTDAIWALAARKQQCAMFLSTTTRRFFGSDACLPQRRPKWHAKETYGLVHVVTAAVLPTRAPPSKPAG
jgi:hypothetical protein